MTFPDNLTAHDYQHIEGHRRDEMTTEHAITFTPGPWTFNAARNAPQDLGGYLTGPKGEYLGDVQWRGNGPLLALAPELLDFCRAVVERYNTNDQLGGLGDWGSDLISKALGS